MEGLGITAIAFEKGRNSSKKKDSKELVLNMVWFPYEIYSESRLYVEHVK
jgi:hypothetical protein